jgi:hypothetical protein
MADGSKASTLSPIVRAKQWIEDVASLSPFYRRRSFSGDTIHNSNFKGESGYKSAPDHFIIGHGFTHMKKLRDVCRKGIGGESYEVSNSMKESYSKIYGASADLNIEEENSLYEADEIAESIDCLKIVKKDSCPKLFDTIHPTNANHANSTLFPVPWSSYVDIYDNASTGSIETSCRKSTSFDLSRNSSEKNQDELEKENLQDTRRLEKLSLKSFSSDHKTDCLVSGGKYPPISNNSSTERKTRIKIGLQYFKNKRQLRVLLQTVELQKSKHCKVFVKVSMVNCNSKQKVVSRRTCCTSDVVDLNEVLYIDQQDERTNGKMLRVRLYKESRFTKRVKLIGEANISLDDLDISFNTCLWVVLRKTNWRKMVRV